MSTETTPTSLFVRGQPPGKTIVRVVVALVIVSQVLALSADLLLAGIVDRYPALLIALNPRNRNLVLATNQLDPVTFYVVGFCRLVLSDPLYYLLGLWYGDRAIAWTARRSRTYGPFVRDGEALFRKAAYPLIFFSPNNLICALSAATGVKVRAFIALNITGTVFRLIVIRQVGEVFASPLSSVVDFIGRYRLPIFLVSVVAVAWTIFGEFRGDNSELAALTDLTNDDDDDDHVVNDDAEGETHPSSAEVSDRVADDSAAIDSCWTTNPSDSGDDD